MDKYVILEVIGEGSFGQVYKCRIKNNTEEIPLAMKVIRMIGQSEADISTLRRECLIQRQLDHENIVKVVESFEESKVGLVLVTEFVDGGNLAMLMSKYPGLTSTDGNLKTSVKSLTVDLICALHYLHGQRVFHRDLKPQNVLIEQNNGKAKLADFGFARNLSKRTQVLTSIKGTPLYMAPELIEEKPYDFKADLWSAGAILFEAAFEKPPFDTNSLFALIKMIRYESVTWPSQKTPFVAFLQGLLEKNPKKRMDWDAILKHDYLQDDAKIQKCLKLNLEFTKTLTDSQELAKEIQRQNKAKKLSGGSQTLINIAQGYEERKRFQQKAAATGQRRHSDFPQAQQHIVKPVALVGPTANQRRHSDVAKHTAGINEELSFNNEEWMQFLDSQIHDGGVSIINDLVLLMKPFQVSKSSNEVLVKTVATLAVPFLTLTAAAEDEICKIAEAFSKAKVIDHVQHKLLHVDHETEVIKAMLMLLARLSYLDQAAADFVSDIDASLIASFLNNSDDPTVKKYCLDILIQMASRDSTKKQLSELNSDVLLNSIESHPKKAIMLMSLIPCKRSDLKLWLKNNKMHYNTDDDEKLVQLTNKILSI